MIAHASMKMSWKYPKKVKCDRVLRARDSPLVLSSLYACACMVLKPSRERRSNVLRHTNNIKDCENPIYSTSYKPSETFLPNICEVSDALCAHVPKHVPNSSSRRSPEGFACNRYKCPKHSATQSKVYITIRSAFTSLRLSILLSE
jgi:hypothetical protein